MTKENPWQDGWDTLVEHSKRSRRALFRLREAFLEAEVIYYDLKGFPPKKVMHWHPQRYNEFIGKKKLKSNFL
jgi:hypothetical protein